MPCFLYCVNRIVFTAHAALGTGTEYVSIYTICCIHFVILYAEKIVPYYTNTITPHMGQTSIQQYNSMITPQWL